MPLMAPTTETVRLQRALIDQLVQVTDRHTRDLLTAWVGAWDEIAPDLQATLEDMAAGGGPVTRGMLLRSTRLRALLAEVAARISDLAAQTGVVVAGDLHSIIDNAGAAQAAILASQIPPVRRYLIDATAWARTDPAQLDAIVARTTQQITSLTRPLSVDAYRAVRRELVRGVAAGSNPRATARRILARTRGPFLGGAARAATIARTETLDAYRAATSLGQSQHAEVLEGWEWVAALSARTCAACLSMHGTRHPLSEPGPNGHQQCRCDRVGIVRSWGDLGITGITEPGSQFPDADQYFRGLPTSDQQQILGRDGYQAWLRGEWPRERWATRQRNPGWRDSYVPASPPKPRAGRRPSTAA